jgi:hypothetical protein
MFLIHTLFIFSTIYAISALLAETIFTSPVERKIPIAVRVGLAYFLSLFYFVSAWLFMSIRQAWLLGLVLLGLYIYGKISKGLLNLGQNFIKGLLKEHAKILGVFLLWANLFFLPLHLAQDYGPFTEGGGDVSIYSDVAKRLTDFNLNAAGLEETASFRDKYQGIKNIISRNYSNQYKSMSLELSNPPEANYQSDKLVFGLIKNPIQFTPCAQYAFLSAKTNYPVFFAILAFLYSLILASVWCFFRPFGWFPAILAVLLVGGGYSLVSAFYNMYLLHVLSTAFLTLTLVSILFIRLYSIAGLRTYGLGVAFISMGYIHFLPLIIPLLAITLFQYFYSEATFQKESKEKTRTKLLPQLGYSSAWILFSIFCLSAIFIGFVDSIDHLKSLVDGNLSIASLKEKINPRMGASITVFSERWWVYFFGIASQQHFQPFVIENEFVNLLIPWGIGFGFFALAFGFILILVQFFRIFSTKQKNIKAWHIFWIYLASLFSIIVYSMVTQSSHYMQGKSAQYLVVFVYFLMLLPLMDFSKKEKLTRWRESWKRNPKFLYACVLLCFSVSLWIPRIVYAKRIALHKDRSSIIEPSFFSEAERIKREDKNPFVIFEPRISGDVYFPFQSLAGYRLVPSRHLVLLELSVKGGSRKNDKYISRLPSDFITQKDLPHLWKLTPKKIEGKYKWQGEKLINRTTPDLIFTGHDYQRDFGIKSRSKRTNNLSDSNDKGNFSYLRNGTVMIYLPSGGPFHLEVKIYNRNEADLEDFKLMANEVSRRISLGDFESLSSMEEKGGVITLKFDFSTSTNPRLSLISRYSSEYWFNARLDGKEMVEN